MLVDTFNISMSSGIIKLADKTLVFYLKNIKSKYVSLNRKVTTSGVGTLAPDLEQA